MSEWFTNKKTCWTCGVSLDITEKKIKMTLYTDFFIFVGCECHFLLFFCDSSKKEETITLDRPRNPRVYSLTRKKLENKQKCLTVKLLVVCAYPGNCHHHHLLNVNCWWSCDQKGGVSVVHGEQCVTQLVALAFMALDLYECLCMGFVWEVLCPECFWQMDHLHNNGKGPLEFITCCDRLMKSALDE